MGENVCRSVGNKYLFLLIRYDFESGFDWRSGPVHQAQSENVISLGQIALFVSLVYPQNLEHWLAPSRYLGHDCWLIELTSF